MTSPLHQRLQLEHNRYNSRIHLEYHVLIEQERFSTPSNKRGVRDVDMHASHLSSLPSDSNVVTQAFSKSQKSIPPVESCYVEIPPSSPPILGGASHKSKRAHMSSLLDVLGNTKYEQRNPKHTNLKAHKYG